MNIHLPSNYIFLGKTGSGKTQCFKSLYSNILCEQYPIRRVFVFCPTAEFSTDYDYVDRRFVFSNPNKFKDIIVKIAKLCKSTQTKGKVIQTVIIIDDSIGSFNFNDPDIINLIVTARHFNLSFIIMTQQLTRYIQGAIRNNFSYLFINNVSDNSNIKCLYELTCCFDSIKECKKYISANCVNHNTIMINNNSTATSEPYVFNSQTLFLTCSDDVSDL